jgi:hypothetical protein
VVVDLVLNGVERRLGTHGRDSRCRGVAHLVVRLVTHISPSHQSSHLVSLALSHTAKSQQEERAEPHEDEHLLTHLVAIRLLLIIISIKLRPG